MPNYTLQIRYGQILEKIDFFKAILNYQQRERRFGKISEQIENDNE